MSVAANPPSMLFRGLTGTKPLPKSEFKSIGRDNSFDPFWIRRNYLRNENEQITTDLIGYLIPAADMVTREELYAAAWTPKGRFVTWVAVVNAYHNGWIFTQTKKKREPLNPRLEDRLVELTSQYNLKASFIQANWLRRVFGQALWFIRQIAPKGMKKRFEIRVVPIWKENIEYNDDGTVKVYRPIVPIGNNYAMQYEITPEEGELWVNNQDPFSDITMGTSELLAIYKTIKRSENIAESYAELIFQKGLGQLDIEIEGVNTAADAKRWADLYKGLVQDSIVVHSPDMKTQMMPGINSGYNYNGTQESYYEDVAAGTGFPQMRMRGVQTGTVTGSETDQDNMAEVYSGIQESSEVHMKKCYLILDRFYLTGKSFEIDWKFEIKMDQTKKSNKFATDINSIMTGARILTVDQAMLTCDLPIIGGPEGSMILQQWIDLNFPVENPEEETEETESEGSEPEETTQGDSLFYKRRVASALLKAGITLRPVNAILKQAFDSGMAFNDLCDIRDNKVTV